MNKIDNFCVNSEIKNDIMNHDISHNEIDYENRQCRYVSENSIKIIVLLSILFKNNSTGLNSLIKIYYNRNFRIICTYTIFQKN